MTADPTQNQNESILSALYRVSQTLSASQDTGKILAQVMGAVTSLTGAERVILALRPGYGLQAEPHPGQGDIQEGERYGSEPEELGASRQVIDAVMESGAGMIVGDARSDPRFAGQGQAEGSPRSILCAPLRVRGRLAGALCIESRPRAGLFGEADLQTASAFACLAAAALENERLQGAALQESQARSKFVSVVTHELRIPMTSIKGYTDLLRQGAVGPVNEMQLNFLNVVRNNVERMSALVSDLADLARMETGRLKLESTMIPVAPTVETALGDLRPRLEEKSQALEVNLSPGLPQVYVDPNRLAQILTVLITNAWKYTPAGGKISIAARPEGEHIRLEVSDTGIGISEQDLPRVFTQFFRSEDPAVREQQGWGLGLSVASGLVELMGGAIGAQSQPGEGSLFWLTLPTASQVVIPLQEQNHLQFMIFDNKQTGRSPV